MLVAVAALVALAAPAQSPADATPTTTAPTTTTTTTTATTTTATTDAAPTTRPAVTVVRRSIAATQWPIEPALSAGFLCSTAGLVPYAGLTAFVPVIPGVGPTVMARGALSTVGDDRFLEGIVGIGVGLEGQVGGLRARASIVPAATISAVSDAGVDATTVGPAVLVPLELGVPLGGGVSFSGTLEPGVGSAVELGSRADPITGRSRFFVFVGAGITFGGPVD